MANHKTQRNEKRHTAFKVRFKRPPLKKMIPDELVLPCLASPLLYRFSCAFLGPRPRTSHIWQMNVVTYPAVLISSPYCLLLLAVMRGRHAAAT